MPGQAELTKESPAPDKDARTWAMLCHLGALSGFLLPFGHVLGPLVIWAVKRDESAFIDEQGKEALNFQLTMTIGFFISLALVFILIGFALIGVLCVYDFVMIVVAAIKTNEGTQYRYPFAIRFIK